MATYPWRDAGTLPVVERLKPANGPLPFDVFAAAEAYLPDDLARSLDLARAATEGRVVCVLACDVELDAPAQARLGEVVARGATVAYIAGDRLGDRGAERTRELTNALRTHGFCDARGRAPYRDDFIVTPDRRTAIERAIEFARPYDAVVIAGRARGAHRVEDPSDDDRETALAALEDRLSGPTDVSTPPAERGLRLVVPTPRAPAWRNVSFETLDDTGTTRLTRLVLRHGETFEVNYGEPTPCVIHCVKGACDVVDFGAGRCDVAAGETIAGLATSLYFQRTGDEVELLILAHK